MTARRQATAVGTFEQLAALLGMDDIYKLGELVREPEEKCGRPRLFPGYMYMLYTALISVWRSSRRVETELASGEVWSYICERVRARFPSEPAMWLPPDRSMRRYHYSYVRNRYFGEEALAELLERFRSLATAHAQEIGICDEAGAGSLTHPCLDRVLYADGKVVAPLYRAKPGATRVDARTGEIRTLRSDPDAHLHITGSGEPAYGNKFVLASCRLRVPHSRVILDVRSVPDVGGEATVALGALRSLAPLLPGAQAVLYDGAFRGVHMRQILNELGLLPIVPVTAKAGGKRARKPREEREVRIEAQVVATPTGRETIQLYARAGAIGIGDLDEAGEVVFRRLERVKVLRRPNGKGTFRFYVEYRLPADKGGGLVRVRIDTTTEDDARKLNRSEYVRGIPTDDPDYQRLYPRRSDAESINRALDDTLWLRRAHSLGRMRQLFELMGFALMTNAIAVHRQGRGAVSRAS